MLQRSTNSPTDRNINLRLWPALLIIAGMWLLLIIPGKFMPLTMVFFASMHLGPLLAMIGLSIWWLKSHHVPITQRWLGLIAWIAGLIAMLFLSHPSMIIILIYFGIATAITIPVVVFSLTRSRPWPLRRNLAFGALALFLVGTLCVRIGRIDAGFDFSLAPRWAPTAEDEFLTDIRHGSDAQTVAASALPEAAGPQDWAEFRGPFRDGILRNVDFQTDWDSDPPQELWRIPVGPGWSSFCVVGPTAFTQEQRGQQETVVAYRVDDGSQIWAQSIPARFEASMGGIGPRATPTYDDGHLYVTGGTGVIQCLDASDGKTVWTFDLVNELSVSTPAWGFSSSPLVVDSMVIVFAGGGKGKAVVALDQKDGTVRWKSSDGDHGYGSPQIATIDQQRHIVVSSNRGLRGLDIADGSALWKHDWDIGQMARVTQPLVIGNSVYLGTGYGNGTQRVDVSHSSGQWNVAPSWTAPLKPYFNDFVHYQGHLYGFDDSIFTCIDAETGERNWKRGRYGFGQVLLIEDIGILLVLSEKGDVVLIQADPKRLDEITTFHALDGITWNHPVIADGKLLVRNSEEAACFALPGFEFSNPQTSPTVAITLRRDEL